MNINNTLFLIIISTLFSHAQRFEISIGEVPSEKRLLKESGLSTFATYLDTSPRPVFNPKEKLTYKGYTFENRSFLFAIMEDYLNYKEVKKLTAEVINENVSMHSFIMVKGKMFLFYSIKNSEQDEFSLFVNEVSQDMVLLGSPVRMSTFKHLKESGMNLTISASDDKKYLLITRIHTGKPKSKQVVEFLAIDDSFGSIWSHVMEMEYFNWAVEIQEKMIDNSGNMYLMALDETDEIKPLLYTYFWKTKSLKKAILGMPGGHNFGVRLELIDGIKPMIMGLNDNEKQVSYFIGRLNTKTQVVDYLGSELMPSDFRKIANKGQLGTYSWKVRDIVALSNNSLVANIEGRAAIADRWITYHSSNAYIISFQDNGTSNWIRTVLKDQKINAQVFTGILLVPDHNNVLVIYNDDAKNLNKSIEDNNLEKFNGRSAMIVVQEMDAIGNVKKYPFFNDPSLEGFALDFNEISLIERGLYYGRITLIAKDSKMLTFHVK